MMFFLDIVKATNTTGLKDWLQSYGHFFAIIFQPKFMDLLRIELLPGHLVLACMLFA